MEQETALTAWNKVLSTVLRLPGVKVDRKEFLQKECRPYCTPEQLKQVVEQSPLMVLDIQLINRFANSCIKNHTICVTAASTALGIPGGPAMAATVSGDIAQYYFHVFVLSQKLAYLYGYPDLCDENGNMSEDAQSMLTVFVGVMSGVAGVNQLLHKISQQLAKEAAKRIPQMALTKTIYYPVIKQIGKWLGVKITKSLFGKVAGKVIPVVGGIISGGITYAGFRPSAKRLQKQLLAQKDYLASASSSKKADEAEFTEYEDVEQSDPTEENA